jgi:predicted transcriptional regulator
VTVKENTDRERMLAVLYGEENPFTGLTTQIAGDLAGLRQERGLSQRAVADLMGTSQRQMARLEHGSGPGVRVQLYSIYAFADACDYDTVVSFVKR